MEKMFMGHVPKLEKSLALFLKTLTANLCKDWELYIILQNVHYFSINITSSNRPFTGSIH